MDFDDDEESEDPLSDLKYAVSQLRLDSESFMLQFCSDGRMHDLIMQNLESLTDAMLQSRTPRAYLYMEDHMDESIDYTELWNELGRGLSQMHELESLLIFSEGERDSDSLDVNGALTVISHVTRIKRLSLDCNYADLYPRQVRALASSMSRMKRLESFALKYFSDALSLIPVLHVLSSALPNLSDVDLVSYTTILDADEPLGFFLRTPSLRQVSFEGLTFERELCRQVATVLEKGTAVQKLNLTMCQFQDGQAIFQALQRNATVSSLLVQHNSRNVSSGTHELAAILASTNTTLKMLELRGLNNWTLETRYDPELPTLFSALGQNKTLETLKLWDLVLPDEMATSQICRSLRNCLETNTTLKSLTLRGASIDDNVWLKVVPFLRSNRTLQCLKLDLCWLSGDAIAATGKELATNDGLTQCEINCACGSQLPADDNIVSAFSEIKENKTLQVFSILIGAYSLVESAGDSLVSMVQENYVLRKVDAGRVKTNPKWRRRLDTILKLNAAGRRYLNSDKAYSRWICAGVLGAVSNDLDCIFFHLRENPSFCSLPVNSRKRRTID